MLVEDRDEPLVVRWFEQVGHFMDDDALQQILRLLYQFGVQADVSSPVIATVPLGLHPLEKIPVQAGAKSWFPLLCLATISFPGQRHLELPGWPP